MPNPYFPPLPDNFEPTRATLHAYSHAATAIPRALGTEHPKWWHVSLKVRPEGLSTDSVAIPGGGVLGIVMDLRAHVVRLETNQGTEGEWSMTEGITGTEMGDQLLAAAGKLGVEGEFNREKFVDDDPREYEPSAAVTYFGSLVNAVQAFEEHRVGLEGPVSPVQLWPHNFDCSMEWFGTKVATYEEDGETTEYPSQLNLGFYPAGRAYFYSNPFPFDEALVDKPLPHDAEWHTEGWQGTVYYYDQLAGDPDGRQKLLDYAKGVFDLASPTLLD